MDVERRKDPHHESHGEGLAREWHLCQMERSSPVEIDCLGQGFRKDRVIIIDILFRIRGGLVKEHV